MLILGIESSCDETGAAVIKDGRYLLSNVVASQAEIHNRYGGVVPEVASRQQLTTIIPVIETALDQAGCSWENIDAIAATYGPGLAGSLLVGLTVGKAIALAHNLPFLGVNHLEAHIYANWLRGRTEAASKEMEDADWEYQEGDPTFPLMCLVISGAHSELVLVRGHGQYELLGRTRDDAAGEAFDKVARILGLSYPGGPSIQKAAQHAQEELEQQGKSITQALNMYRLPRSWLRGTYDFSFSGLKTSIRYFLRDHPSLLDDRKAVSDLCASVQAAIVDVLVTKTIRAVKRLRVGCITASGGVTCNRALREQLADACAREQIHLRLADKSLCTDNAAMIGILAEQKFAAGFKDDYSDHEILPNWQLV